MVNRQRLLEKLGELVRDKKLPEIIEHPRRRRPPRHRHHHRPQAERHSAGGAQQAVQAHAAAGGLRRHHAVARGRRAARALAQGDAALLHRAPGRRHRAPDALRAGEGRGTRAHPRGLGRRARQHRRGHPPSSARRRPTPRRPLASPSASALSKKQTDAILEMKPAPPDRLGARQDRGRAGRAAREDRLLQARALGDDDARARDHQGRAAGDQEEVRQRRASTLLSADAQGHRRGGPHRRREHGGDGDEGRLREAPARGHLPPAEARRQGHAGREPEGQRLRGAPVRGVDARVHAVLLHGRQGVPPEGVRASRGVAPRARHGHREPAAAGEGGDHLRRHRHEGLPGRRVSSCSPRRTAW